MRKPVLALGLVATLGLGGCRPAPRDPAQWPIALADLERGSAPADPGEAAYRRTCVSCHGVDGKGNGARTGADFTSPTGPLTQSDDALRVSIRDGKTGPIGTMPAHGSLLSSTEQVAVLAYVRRTFGRGVIVAIPVVDAGVDSGP